MDDIEDIGVKNLLLTINQQVLDIKTEIIKTNNLLKKYYFSNYGSNDGKHNKDCEEKCLLIASLEAKFINIKSLFKGLTDTNRFSNTNLDVIKNIEKEIASIDIFLNNFVMNLVNYDSQELSEFYIKIRSEYGLPSIKDEELDDDELCEEDDDGFDNLD